MMMRRFLLCGICLFYSNLCVTHVVALLANRHLSCPVFPDDFKHLTTSHQDDESAQVGSAFRRDFIYKSLLASGLMVIKPDIVRGEEKKAASSSIFTAGFGREEYTNSITASRDTNISPKEVYDSIRSSYVSYPLEQMQMNNIERTPRAWDVGAGAGVSTQTLYNMGYKNIEAIDWSSKAWDENVDEALIPNGVHFSALDDERFFLDKWKQEKMDRFDMIVFNFAINESKAKFCAKEMLNPDVGRLFAPVNVQNDYWLKQAFRVYDGNGDILWNVQDVGAWSVQFQPDVTQDTCQGIWCAPFNGFEKKKRS